jgi:dihydroorotase
VEPPLGSAKDREQLKQGLRDGRIAAVAVHHQALDPEEQLLPVDQRRPGVAGHRFVLPALWQELVEGDGWSPDQLWQVLCFGPASLLGLEPPTLQLGSDRWVLFDPSQVWSAQGDPYAPLAANQPLGRSSLKGQVVATGLNPQLWRRSS